jgi:peptide/nickel transport system substrate-binding protein
MVIRIDKDIVSFDPYYGTQMTLNSANMERLHADDWTVDPAVFNYSITWRPSDYVKGQLAETWEFTDPNTYVLHIRHGVAWQNIAPANGRDFTADDVLFHYNRMYGLGGGFTKGSPFYSATQYADLVSLTAPDKYTVIFKWKTPNPEVITETLQAASGEQLIECPDAVKQWGDMNTWQHTIGTGPFMFKDFVPGSSATMVKNPNYWGYDERYPKNKLPYIDTLKVLIIPNTATTMAAMRTGKIDVMDGIALQPAQDMAKTNPEIVQFSTQGNTCSTIDPRIDTKPFTDIKVRQAMQLAIDVPTIAKTYFGGRSESTPLALTSYYETGWGWPYAQWPQSLKDEYSYNPAKAKQLLADAGYPTGFKTNVVCDASGDLDELQIVKGYLAAVGIDMTINPMESNAWNQYVRINHKQDQMAQRTAGSLAYSYEPVRQLYKYMTNYSLNFGMISDPTYDAFVTKALAATSVDAMKAVLRDANEYVVRQHWVISLIAPNTFTLAQPWLLGFNAQNNAITGTGTGPNTLAFYASRYWIDQKLKASYGH